MKLIISVNLINILTQSATSSLISKDKLTYCRVSVQVAKCLVSSDLAYYEEYTDEDKIPTLLEHE